MPSFSLRRRDPFWDADGVAARRHRRWRRFMGLVAFVVSLGAVGGAAVAWAVELGFATGIGIQLALLVHDRPRLPRPPGHAGAPVAGRPRR